MKMCMEALKCEIYEFYVWTYNEKTMQKDGNDNKIKTYYESKRKQGGSMQNH